MNKKTKILIAVLAATCSGLILFFVLQKKQLKETPSLFPSLPPTPTPITVPPGYVDVYTEQKTTKETSYPLLEKTPYRTTHFELSYSGPLKLKVVMYSKNQTEIKNEVYSWIRENGVNPATHQIEFVEPTPPTPAP